MAGPADQGLSLIMFDSEEAARSFTDFLKTAPPEAGVTARSRGHLGRRSRGAPIAQIDCKALSKRIGQADVAFTMKQYVQTDLKADRQVANTLAELIVCGALVSTEVTDEMNHGRKR